MIIKWEIINKMDIYNELVNQENQNKRNKILRALKSHETELPLLKKQNKSFQYEEDRIRAIKDELMQDPNDFITTSEVLIEDRIKIIEYWLQHDFETIKNKYLNNINSLFLIMLNMFVIN